MANGINTDPGINDTPNYLNITEAHSGSNGNFTVQKLAMMGQYSSDIEDYDDEENDGGGGLTRNSRFSRSIRKAYGAGRITLLDMGNRRVAGSNTNVGQRPDQANVQTENVNENTNVKVLSRLSRSAENLHIFKAPFRRKAPSLGSPLPNEDPQKTVTSNTAANIQRTASTSSVDLQSHNTNHRKTPVKTKGPMLKLVGSMTDLTVRRRRSPTHSPTSPSPMTPLSRLHDDYSRRVPCLQTSERQHRPSPVRARVLSLEHSPLLHHQPEYDVISQQHQVLINPVFVDPPVKAEETSPVISAHYKSWAVATSGYNEMAECNTSPLNQKETLQHHEQTVVNSLSDEVRQLTRG